MPSLALMLLCALVVFFSSAAVKRPQSRWVALMRLHDAHVCTTRNYLTDANIVIRTDKDGSDYAVADWKLAKAMRTINKFELHITKCTGGVAPNLCEYYTTFRWVLGLCELCPAPNVMWSPLVSSVTPPWRCPLPKGRYHLANGTVDREQVFMFLGPDAARYIWIVQVRLFDEDGDLNHCFNLTASMMLTRRRPSSK